MHFYKQGSPASITKQKETCYLITDKKQLLAIIIFPGSHMGPIQIYLYTQHEV